MEIYSEESVDSDIVFDNKSNDSNDSTCDTIINEFNQCTVEERQIFKIPGNDIQISAQDSSTTVANSKCDTIVIKFKECIIKEEQQSSSISEHEIQTIEQDDYTTVMISNELQSSALTDNVLSKSIIQEDIATECNEMLVNKKQTRDSATNTDDFKSTNYRHTKRYPRYNPHLHQRHNFKQRNQLPRHNFYLYNEHHQFNLNRKYGHSNYNYYPQYHNNYNHYKHYQVPHRFHNKWEYDKFQMRRQHYEELLHKGFYLFSQFLDYVYNM